MKYKVRIKIFTKDGGTEIIKVPFHWKKISRACRGFEPTPAARKFLNQFPEWENLDTDTPAEN